MKKDLLDFSEFSPKITKEYFALFSTEELHGMICSYQNEKGRLFAKFLNLLEIQENTLGKDVNKLESEKSILWEKHLQLDGLIGLCLSETTRRIGEQFRCLRNSTI